jgi:Domain of unknown function (DUF4145)
MVARIEAESPQARILELASAAEELARTAKRNGKTLTGLNFYGNKLVQLRTDANVAFRSLSAESVGDISALAELVDACFDPKIAAADRRQAVQQLRLELSTRWAHAAPIGVKGEEDALFPLALLQVTRRTYLAHIGRQMNGCFVQGWYDACAVMMRRLMEAAIIEAFEGKGIADNAKNVKGDYLQLSDLIDRALGEKTWNLSRNTKTYLPKMRDVGHMSAHGRYFTAQRSDIEKVQQGCRIVVEEFLRIAGLL